MNFSLLSRASYPLRFGVILPLIYFAALANSQGVKPKEQETETVDLPSFTVKANNFEAPKPKLWGLFQPKPWQYAQIDGLEILSNAPEAKTKRLLRYFQIFKQALVLARPVEIQPLAEATLIICGADNEFANFTDRKGAELNGFPSQFLRDREKMAIVLDLQAINYNAFIKGSSVELEVSPWRQLYREYARYLYTQEAFPPPPWLLEGNVQIAMDLETWGRVINYGKLDTSRGAPGEAPEEDESEEEDTPQLGERIPGVSLGQALASWTSDPPFTVALLRKKLLPMEELFAVKASDSPAINTLVDSDWSKQAHAFVHYCKFGAKQKYKQAFDTFVQRLASEANTEQLFVECFEMSYADMLKKLRGYIDYPRHHYNHYKLYKEDKLQAVEVEFREATPSEIGRIKGNAQHLAGLREAALATYRLAYEKDDADPKLQATLGIAEQLAGNTEQARQLLEAATALGVATPSAWTALAQLRLDEANATKSGKLSSEQMSHVFQPLLKARELQPPLPETYRIMAKAWEASSVSPLSQHIDLIGEGAIIFPFDADLIFRTAFLYNQVGDKRRAMEIADMGLRFARDNETRSRFKSLLDSLHAEAEASPTALPSQS